jgi:hypothetical protein
LKLLLIDYKSVYLFPLSRTGDDLFFGLRERERLLAGLRRFTGLRVRDRRLGLRERDCLLAGLRDRARLLAGLRDRERLLIGLRDRTLLLVGLRDRDRRSAGLRDRVFLLKGSVLRKNAVRLICPIKSQISITITTPILLRLSGYSFFSSFPPKFGGKKDKKIKILLRSQYFFKEAEH